MEFYLKETKILEPNSHYIYKGCCIHKTVLKCHMLFAKVIVIFFCLPCLFLYRSFECEMKIKVWYIYLKIYLYFI